MVLLDCLVILILALLCFSAMQILSFKTKGIIASVMSVISGIIALCTAVILLSNGAPLEELFLVFVIFGAVSVSVHYFGGEAKPAKDKSEKEAIDK